MVHEELFTIPVTFDPSKIFQNFSYLYNLKTFEIVHTIPESQTTLSIHKTSQGALEGVSIEYESPLCLAQLLSWNVAQWNILRVDGPMDLREVEDTIKSTAGSFKRISSSLESISMFFDHPAFKEFFCTSQQPFVQPVHSLSTLKILIERFLPIYLGDFLSVPDTACNHT